MPFMIVDDISGGAGYGRPSPKRQKQLSLPQLPQLWQINLSDLLMSQWNSYQQPVRGFPMGNVPIILNTLYEDDAE